MWCLHQTSRQTSILRVNTRWDTVLKLQSWSPSTFECHRTIISWEEQPKKVVFLTDSLSALQALMSGEPDTTEKKLTENISTLVQSPCIILQWILAHTGFRGNEIAHQLVQEGRKKEQPPSHLSYREVTPSVAMTPTDTNIYFAPEQDTADWIAISRGLAQTPQLNAPVEKRTKHQNITCNPAHSTTKQSSRFGQLVRPQKPSSGGLLRICYWHPSMRHSQERGFSQRNHHIERKRRRRRRSLTLETRKAVLLTYNRCNGFQLLESIRSLTFPSSSSPWTLSAEMPYTELGVVLMSVTSFSQRHWRQSWLPAPLEWTLPKASTARPAWWTRASSAS